ncbi:formate dehydrogenase subunit delta [Methylobacterium radiodurans]|uniref:Peptidase n=1 Tax=Methylobacterium radiodurans TaxID=2202828 RepID=A0A2U8VN42_9HYPH|nr:formate dehydrogenase subunit delta [Methylobacterium radiodurans]AWN35017.1 peptidase [Methylobacterium radiodurans]
MSALTQADKLVRMANQIAAFFRSYPEEEAVAGIDKHIRAFWTPKMIAHLENALPEQGDRVDELVVRALSGAEPQADSPVRAATRDPQLLGAGASDAG